MAPKRVNEHHVDSQSQRKGGSQYAADASESNYILLCCSQDLELDQMEKLRECHVEIKRAVDIHTFYCHYMPTDLAKVRSLPFVEYANVYHPDLKISPSLKEKALSSGDDAPEYYNVALHDRTRVSESVDEIVALLSYPSLRSRIDIGHAGDIVVPIKSKDLLRVAGIDNVERIEAIRPKRAANYLARQVMGFLDGEMKDKHYTDKFRGLRRDVVRGVKQTVVVADTGFDKGSIIDVHDAFIGRVQDIVNYSLTQQKDTDGHGTHVAGSVLGSGFCKDFGVIEGTAPGANLVMQNIVDSTGALDSQPGGKSYTKLFAESLLEYGPQNPENINARVHNNSYGEDWTAQSPTPYSTNAGNLDSWIREFRPDAVIVISAGNEGGSIADLTKGTVQSEACAKNVITVGACNNEQRKYTNVVADAVADQLPHSLSKWWKSYIAYTPSGQLANPDELAPFSCRGPTPDGRRKPDIVAPGTLILSARSREGTLTGTITKTLFPWFTVDVLGKSPDPRWYFMQGTSMSAPLVSGMCAVIRNIYFEKRGCYPSAAMVKALLVNGAHDITTNRISGQLGPPPNNLVGFGRADLGGAIKPLVSGPSGFVFDGQRFDADNVKLPGETLIKPGGEHSVPVTVDPVTAKLTVTLAYHDDPGPTVQNVLRLLVRKVDGAKIEFEKFAEDDTVTVKNNVQRIVLDLAPGQYQVVVLYVPNPAWKRPPQAFALCYVLEYSKSLDLKELD